jgi:hypothetical protein
MMQSIKEGMEKYNLGTRNGMMDFDLLGYSPERVYALEHLPETSFRSNCRTIFEEWLKSNKREKKDDTKYKKK